MPARFVTAHAPNAEWTQVSQNFIERKQPNTRKSPGTRRARCQDLLSQDDRGRTWCRRSVVVGHQPDPALDGLARTIATLQPNRQRTVCRPKRQEHQRKVQKETG